MWRSRLPPIDRPGARPIDELRAQRLAATAGLAPLILAAHPAVHWLLMEYIDAPVWSREQLQAEAGADALARQLARLHELPVPADLPVVDVPAMARAYLVHLAAADAKQAADLAPLVARVAVLSARMASFAVRPVLNHGDMMAGNMLGHQPLLVDWEYAQVAEPTWDLACLLTYYPDLARFTPRLLAGAGLAGTAAAAALELQRERFELLNRLWERLAAQGAG